MRHAIHPDRARQKGGAPAALPREQVQVLPRFMWIVVLSSVAIVSVIVAMVAIQVHNPYVHGEDRDWDEVPYSPFACLTHYSGRGDTGVYIFHGVVEGDTGDLDTQIPLAGLFGGTDLVRFDNTSFAIPLGTNVSLDRLLAHIRHRLCRGKTTPACYVEQHVSDDGVVKHVSMGFIQHTGVALMAYAGCAAALMVMLSVLATVIGRRSIMMLTIFSFLFFMGGMGYAEFRGASHMFFVGIGLAFMFAAHGATFFFTRKWFTRRGWYGSSIAASGLLAALAGALSLTEMHLAFLVAEQITVAFTVAVMAFPAMALVELEKHVTITVDLAMLNSASSEGGEQHRGGVAEDVAGAPAPVNHALAAREPVAHPGMHPGPAAGMPWFGAGPTSYALLHSGGYY